MVKKRDRITIIEDLLNSIQVNGGDIKPTRLMYKANLSYSQMSSYLEELVTKNMVKKIQKNTYDYITITDNGHKFLQKIKEMRSFEETFGL